VKQLIGEVAPEEGDTASAPGSDGGGTGTGTGTAPGGTDDNNTDKPKCTVEGLTDLDADDEKCKAPEKKEKCTIEGKTDLDADSPDCKQDETPVPEDPLPPTPDPCESGDCEIIEPCEVSVLTISDYYNVGEPAESGTEEVLPSTKQLIWDHFILAGLSPEQTAAVMGSIDGISLFNPASLTSTAVVTTSPEGNTDTSESITGLGLIHWGDLNEVESLLAIFSSQDVLDPFFAPDNWELYGASSVDGDKFFELAKENGVLDKAKTLLNIQLNQIDTDLMGTNFFSYTDLEEAVNYFWTHLIKTTGDTGASVPAEFINNAIEILAEFGDQTEEPEPENPTEGTEDPDCVDGYRPISAGTLKDLLALIQYSVGSNTAISNSKNEVYNSALNTSSITPQFEGKDAFAFVAAMIRASYYHKNYPVINSAGIAPLEEYYSAAWEKTTSQPQKLSKLVADKSLEIGDVLISSDGSQTMIYIGEQTFSDKKPFALAVTGSAYPHYVSADADQMRDYNVYRRKTTTISDSLGDTSNSIVIDETIVEESTPTIDIIEADDLQPVQSETNNDSQTPVEATEDEQINGEPVIEEVIQQDSSEPTNDQTSKNPNSNRVISSIFSAAIPLWITRGKAWTL
jgi:hypothetical protein